MKIFISIIILLLLITNIVCIYRLQQYQTYYEESEKLLMQLDSKYDWVDAFDPEGYYLAADKIRN